MIKKISYISIFFLLSSTTLAMGFNFWNFSISDFLFGKPNTEATTSFIEQKKIPATVSSEEFVEQKSNLKNVGQKKDDSEENFNYEDLIKLEASKKSLQAKMKLLVVNTKVNLSVEETCKFSDPKEKIACKRDLFIGCADSLYLSFDMTAECQQFSSVDYLKYIEAKKTQEVEKSEDPISIDTEVGRVEIRTNKYTSLNDPDLKNTINSSSVNSNFEVKDSKTEIEERKIVEPTKPVLKTYNIKWNTYAQPQFTGWITGWGTLFAINGGRMEAGQIMNNYTAFGYNPYSSNVCIVSLPYKTIDKFFGTNLDRCVKNKNLACIIQIKSQLKNRAIEVIMLKNGQKAILPLGEFGPAEWTGNALDFTSCARKTLGATGKDLVKFRVYLGK